jgi:hypothetical protein
MTPLVVISAVFALTLAGLFGRLRRRRTSHRELVGLVELLAVLARERRTG